jgi:hypothetical protein
VQPLKPTEESAPFGRSLTGMKLHGSNRRMRKTARPVVWKGCGAQSPYPHPITSPGCPCHWQP